jgi:hypothetical protein
MKINTTLILSLLFIHIHNINFPIYLETIYIINNPNTNNVSNIYTQQYPTFIQPIIISSITNIEINSTFIGSIIPSFTNNINGYLVTLNVQGNDWNTSVTFMSVSVIMLENNPTSYQSLMVNLTNTTTSVAINPQYINTSCQLQIFLMGWYNI